MSKNLTSDIIENDEFNHNSKEKDLLEAGGNG